ncbi:hypothetical protein [Streptomyces swartbergensis]|uniref:hypothetical protein n=1 Tax=Streptomyces swartbergensis TaxID=487165 RepID=UPI0011809658|nr:hypothetical protein [Streptomyces swartbergensis]
MRPRACPGAVAHSPGIADGLSLTARDYAVPDPHRQEVDGRDLFRNAAHEALAAGGVRVRWVENFAWSPGGRRGALREERAARHVQRCAVVEHRPGR